MALLSNMTRPEGDPKIIEKGASAVPASDRIARSMGWFSLGLGIAELFAAESIAKALGMQGKEGLIRAYGVREIGSGILSLSVDKQAGMISRVAGDSLDIITLLGAMTDDNPKKGNVGVALAAVLGATLFDLMGAGGTTVQHARPSRSALRDYSDRTGFPKGLSTARGSAREQAGGAETQPLVQSPAPAAPLAG